jgi:hypothetical protein
VKGEYEGSTFKRYSGFKPRDLMAEGSGFLQMLSVFVLALSPETQVILLDEPDAHLHSSLQTQLVEQLEGVADEFGKQVAIATHSTEILRHAEYSRIMQFRGSGAKYLSEPDQRVGLFVGLGSEYSPRIDPLRRHRRMLIVENMSDARLLQEWSRVLGLPWPENLVPWPWAGGNKQRKQLFIQLKRDIPELRAISIVDRDDLQLNQVDKFTLEDRANPCGEPHLSLRVWRRRHIENYLLSPSAIARASGFPEEAVTEFMAEHALAVPADFISRDVAEAMIDARGKEITQDHLNSVKNTFGATPHEIASAMQVDEICDDVREILEQIANLCAEDSVLVAT